MNKIAAMVLALAACAASVQAQVFKWVDKDGKVQYSDQPPPPDASKSALQKVISTSTPDAPSGKAAEKAPDKGKEFEKRRSESAEKQKKGDEAAKLGRQKQESCDDARANLKSLEAGGRLSKADASGERYFLDDDQRQKEIARAQDVMADSCK